MKRREWGAGAPVIALHPLGLDSRAFEGIGEHLAGRGFRTIAVDLPGFGETPGDGSPLTPLQMARAVIGFAESLDQPPVVIGISMGGRVALEAGLRAPRLFRSVVAIAPFLPWLRGRRMLQLAKFFDPDAADRLPLERNWQTLKRWADALESVPYLKDDAVARAGTRLIYHLSCPATRWSFISAAREMALDPAFGPQGFWNRLPEADLPLTFVWGGRDRLVSMGQHRSISRVQPFADQRVLPCLAHAMNGGHHRCLAEAVADIVDGRHSQAPRVAEIRCAIARRRDGRRTRSAGAWLPSTRR